MRTTTLEKTCTYVPGDMYKCMVYASLCTVAKYKK